MNIFLPLYYYPPFALHSFTFWPLLSFTYTSPNNFLFTSSHFENHMDNFSLISVLISLILFCLNLINYLLWSYWLSQNKVNSIAKCNVACSTGTKTKSFSIKHLCDMSKKTDLNNCPVEVNTSVRKMKKKKKKMEESEKNILKKNPSIKLMWKITRLWNWK